MTNDEREREDLETLYDLAAEVIHGTASEAQLARLEERLRSDPKARSAYLHYALLHAQLNLTDAALIARAVAPDRADSPAGAEALGEVPGSPRSWRAWILRPFALNKGLISKAVRTVWDRPWMACTAAVCFIALLVVGLTARRERGDGGVASLIEARDIVWAEGRAPIGASTRLRRRQDIRWLAGTLKIAFDPGALVTVEGPAELRVLSAMRILAVRGRITAHVDGRAKGFAIETPNTLVVDQGTEFGVEIHASGQTDVVVFQGLVDLAHSEPADRPAPIKRLGQGEGMSIGSAGLLSRIVSVERRPGDDEWATGPSSDNGAVIRSVRDNIRGLGSSKFYQIVRRGLGDDAPAYVDRTHQWNGLDEGGLPAFLRGADYIMTFNDDKRTVDLSVTVELARAATLYVFYDTRLPTPRWLLERFTDTGVLIGLDEGPWPGGSPQRVGRGPGTSIDTLFSVWKCDLGPDESINLGAMENGGNNAMYGIAAVSRP